jgi:predicted nucleic acid-binding protein
LIDDAAGLKCERQLGLNLIGTGGILILAKRAELISSFMNSIEMVRDSGLWISDEVVDMLRKKAGE